MNEEQIVKRIFIASPSDVENERRRIDGIVREVNTAIGTIYNFRFEVVKWETHASPHMGRPQQVINDQLGIQNCDVFIGIIWKKFGSPTGGVNGTGVKFESGTEEEFHIAYESWKNTKTPDILFFRSTKSAPPSQIDVGQLNKVESFFKDFSYDQAHPGLYREYRTINEFEKQLRVALLQYALLAKRSNSDSETINKHDYLKRYGIIDVFVPDTNDLRNSAKRLSLQRGKNIRLIAHSCYSYFAVFGNRFRGIVEEKLKSGERFLAIAANPWSESSLFASLEEAYNKIDDYQYVGKDGKVYLDCIRIIEDSQCYRVKYQTSIAGYLSLKEQYGDKIQLRFTKFEMMSTILLTEDECYLEPYLPVNLRERYNKGMLTFELKVTNTSHLYRHNQKYFDFLWNLSEDYESYCSHINDYKERLKNKTLLEVLK